MSLEFPFLVRLQDFYFFLSRSGERGCVFAVSPPIPGKGILDYIAHGPIIQVLTVVQSQWLIEQKTSFMERSCAQEAIGNHEYGFRGSRLFLGSNLPCIRCIFGSWKS